MRLHKKRSIDSKKQDYWNQKVKELTDDELENELVKLTNDSYLLSTTSELQKADYYERHNAIWNEIDERGLTEPDITED